MLNFLLTYNFMINYCYKVFKTYLHHLIYNGSVNVTFYTVPKDALMFVDRIKRVCEVNTNTSTINK